MNLLGSCQLSMNPKTPFNPQYQTDSDRRKSFHHYSSSYPMQVGELAAAGFFYSGSGDKVTCFWCNGSLEKWDEDDNAWVEHAKYVSIFSIKKTKNPWYCC